MFESIKELQGWEKLPEDIKQSKIFISHLKYYNQPEQIIRIAEKISFKGILELFDIEFEKLWKKMALPEIKKELKELRKDFRENILTLLRHPIFNFLYKKIKDFEEKDIDYKKLNLEIFDFFNSMMYILFRAFDIQFQLSSLNENNDPKIMLREVEKKNKLAKQGEKFQGKSFSSIDIPYFEKVFKEYEETIKKGYEISYRQIALKIAKSELGLSHHFEIQNFYKRFVQYKKKIGKKDVR